MENKRFELTSDLIILLRNSYVMRRLSDVEYGAAEIDGKRPYGNSDVEGDIADLLGWGAERDEYGYLPEEVEARASLLHEQPPMALQIVLSTGSFEPGIYEASPYSNDWRRVE